MRTAALCLAATLAFPVTTLAQPGKTPPVPQTTRPPEAVQYPPQSRVHIYGQVYIGERAPDFSLDGSDGRPLKLSRHKGDWVLLTFSDRKEELAPLRDIQAEMRTLGVQIVGVCKEKARALQVFAARDTLPFVLGADFSGEIAALYGLFDTGRSTISPGLLMIDREGFVRMALLGQRLPPAHVARLAHFAVTGQ